MNQWYVVNTKAREEAKALLNLKRQSFNAYLPQYQKTRRHARRTDSVLAPLFPNYLFVEFDMDITNWSAINSTIGVSSLIKFGVLPTPIPTELIYEIQSREDPQGIVSLNRNLKLKEGDEVNIVAGAFSAHRGIFDFGDAHRLMHRVAIQGETKPS